MERPASSGILFRFGLFEADPARNTLTRSGLRVKIQEQPFRLLLLLLERPGEVVTREQLRQRLWPEGTYVDFDGSLNVILKRLRAAVDDDPDNPRFIETIPRRGYRFIAPVSAVPTDPQAPVPSPSAAAPAAEPVAESPLVPNPSLTGNQRGRPLFLIRDHYLVYASLALVVLVLAAALVWRASSSVQARSGLRNDSFPMRKSVAVLGFQDLSGRAETSWLATALSEMLSTELAAGERLRLVSGEDVENLRVSSPWTKTDTLDQRTTAHLGTALNSDVLVLGSYMMIGGADHGQLRLDVRMQDAKSGEIMIEIADMGSAQDLFRLVSRVGAQLRNRLGVKEIEGNEEAGVLAALPLDPEAARFYSLGVTRLRQFDALAAKDLLEQAAKIDPKFSLVHVMLARAWGQLGYEQKRKQEARTALSLSLDLPRAERLLIEGDYYESLGDHEKAASAYHALFELFPDNVEHGLQLASAQWRAGHGREGLATLAQLRRLPSPASDDPNIDLVEARIAPIKADSLRLIRDALQKAASQHKRLVYAQARHDECITIIYGENPQEGTTSCEDAYDAFMAAGNRLAAADCVRLIGDRLGYEGHYEEAVATYQRALSLLSTLGDLEKSGAVLNNMGEALVALGKSEVAETLFRQAKADFTQAGDQNNVVVVLSNIGDLLFSRGQLAAAAATYDSGVQILATVDLSHPSYLLTRIADLHLVHGETREAARYADEAVTSVQNEAAEDLSTALLTRGNVSLAAGDLPAARQDYERSLEIRRKLGSRLLSLEAQEALASVLLYQGSGQQAVKDVTAVVASLEHESSRPRMAGALTSLVKALLAEGRIREAEQTIARAAEYSREDPDVALHMLLDIESARVRLAKGQYAAGSQQLRETEARARRLGFYNLECEARLALGEAELTSTPAVGRQHLIELASQARAHGMELMAQRAEQQTKVAVAQQIPPTN